MVDDQCPKGGKHDFEGINQWQTVCRKCGIDLDSLSAPSGSDLDEGVVELLSWLDEVARTGEAEIGWPDDRRRPEDAVLMFSARDKLRKIAALLRSPSFPTLIPDADEDEWDACNCTGPVPPHHPLCFRAGRQSSPATPAIRDQAFVGRLEQHLPDCATNWADGDCDCCQERLNEAIRALKGTPPSPIDADEAVLRFSIKVEKLLCAKLGIDWSPTGISIESLVERLPSPDVLKGLVEALEDSFVTCTSDWNEGAREYCVKIKLPTLDRAQTALEVIVAIRDAALLNARREQGL